TTVGGDYSAALVGSARAHYGARVPLVRFDAHRIPFRDQCFDAVVLYEAIYYLESPEVFAAEASRVIRRGGRLILCTANKDLPDFNPSPHSYRYFSPPDFAKLLAPAGFSVTCYADCAVDYGSVKAKLLSFVKRMLIRMDLMPKSMTGKKLFRRIVFGKLVPMPHELTNEICSYVRPESINCSESNRTHKVIFAVGHRTS
ncbi:MAG: class I SAM-dependent methyltransferase, partial [Proteobacteria bacterium]|nr:class I SAM-dependent methyltransferase [Pseudomonadota bacterium]